ncbi:MAG: phosphomannomutase/phosphoglucomutase [Desulfobacter sp.]|nr:MAG: phosphomannomutase/phosphoglucomutase [Desulfobacter sp.]
MANIFKAYDVRGIYPEDLNEDLIYKIGKAFSDMLIEETGKEEVTIVVGQDMRISSPSLAQHLIKGVTEQGVNVIDIGLASSPTFFYGVSILNVDGGLQVSASHNPKEYNGVKFVRHKARPVGFDNGIGLVKEKIDTNTFRKAQTTGRVLSENTVLGKEVDFALEKCNPKAIRPMKVVADAANAMGAPYLSELFKQLPCELIPMNFDLDGTFPAHEADPFKEENLKDLKSKVVQEKADLGIATDGDGDRIFFIDDKGDLVEPAILRGIMSKIMLREHPGATICYDIRPGRITRDMIEEAGGVPSVTRVGHTLIKKRAIEENAVFAGESSGHFFFSNEAGVFEMPMIVVLKLLEFISASNTTLSEIVRPLRKYHHSGEINSIVEDKAAKIKQISELYKEGDIFWLDGITVEFKDFWFNVRASNTEPLLRLNLEASTKDLMLEKTDEILNIIRA